MHANYIVIYQVWAAGEMLSYWYEKECAEDYVSEFGGEIFEQLAMEPVVDLSQEKHIETKEIA